MRSGHKYDLFNMPISADTPDLLLGSKERGLEHVEGCKSAWCTSTLSKKRSVKTKNPETARVNPVQLQTLSKFMDGFRKEENQGKVPTQSVPINFVHVHLLREYVKSDDAY